MYGTICKLPRVKHTQHMESDTLTVNRKKNINVVSTHDICGKISKYHVHLGEY